MTTSSEPIFSVQGLRLPRPQYYDRQPIDVTLAKARLIGLIGLNGSGKSTMLQCLAGLITPLRPAETIMQLGGKALQHHSPQERAKLIGYLAQAGAIEWPITAFDVIALGRLPWQTKANGLSKEDATAIAKAVTLTDVENLLQRPADQLSGGEAARVLLARVLASQAPLLLLDEPTAELDPAQQIRIMAEFRKLTAQGQTIVMALHDLSLARRFCDELLVMENGELALHGNTEDVLHHPKMTAIFKVKLKLGNRQTSGDDWLSLLPLD